MYRAIFRTDLDADRGLIKKAGKAITWDVRTKYRKMKAYGTTNGTTSLILVIFNNN